MCKWTVHVVVSLGSQWVLTHDTWRVLLQIGRRIQVRKYNKTSSSYQVVAHVLRQVTVSFFYWPFFSVLKRFWKIKHAKKVTLTSYQTATSWKKESLDDNYNLDPFWLLLKYLFMYRVLITALFKNMRTLNSMGDRQIRFSLPSVKCSAGPPSLRLLGSTASLSELCTTNWLLRARR